MLRSFLLAMILAAFVAVNVGHAREFLSSDVEAPDHPAVKAVVYMGDLMRQRSSGRLNIGSSGALDKDSEIFSVAQVRTGTLDMARISVAALHGSAPAMVIPALPFLFTSVEHRRRSLDGPAGEEILESIKAIDLIGLCFYDVGGRSIYTADKPVRTPADLAGLKIRVQASPAMAEVMQALGAQPVAVPYSQVRTRLAAKTIDAAENNVISYYSSGHYEVAKIYSVTEHTASPALVVFSKRVWDQLPVADQAIVRQAARDSVAYYRKLVDEQEETVRRVLVERGVQFVTDTDKPAFSKILAPLYSVLVPDPRHRALLQQIRPTQ